MGGVKAFSCPNCGGQVGLRAPGQTLTAACKHCGSMIDLSNENLRLIQKVNDKMTRKPIIPIGARGTFEGQEWEVIGFLERKVRGYEYYWEEYLLFNPWYGFRWLINNYGHWGYASPLMDMPDYNGGTHARYKGRRYKRFSRGGAVVKFALGEFYWKVMRGDQVNTIDLVAPPYMLSYEKDKHGQNWTHAAYIEPELVQEAFKLKKMPAKRRIGANQPNTAKQNFKRVLPIFLIALAAVIGLQVFFTGNAKNQNVAEGNHIFMFEKMSHVSTPFKMENGTRNTEIRFHSPNLRQNWIYLEGYLHNKTTNKNFGFSTEWEYYSGMDSDGSWTEGSQRQSVFLNQIPAGEYELVLDAKLGGSLEKVAYYINRDVPFFANFFLILIAISIFPLFLWFRAYTFEKARWEEAD